MLTQFIMKNILLILLVLIFSSLAYGKRLTLNSTASMQPSVYLRNSGSSQSGQQYGYIFSNMADGSSGNIGIGTSTPGNKLEVNGTIRSKEVVVESTGWPDYVFDEGYNLLTLDEGESHIAEKGRLPGRPSADQVDESGVSLGDSQRLFLEKVEELTLYMIEKDKQIQLLQNQLYYGHRLFGWS